MVGDDVDVVRGACLLARSLIEFSKGRRGDTQFPVASTMEQRMILLLYTLHISLGLFPRDSRVSKPQRLSHLQRKRIS